VHGLLIGSERVAPKGAPDPIQPRGWDDGLRLAELPDLDPAPNVVRLELEARVSTVAIEADVPPRDIWTYEGTLPGSLIRAKVGDRLIAEFRIHCRRRRRFTGTGCEVPTT
jgi:hypothetical protein